DSVAVAVVLVGVERVRERRGAVVAGVVAPAVVVVVEVLPERRDRVDAKVAVVADSVAVAVLLVEVPGAPAVVAGEAQALDGKRVSIGEDLDRALREPVRRAVVADVGVV